MLTPAALALIVFLWFTSITGLLSLLRAWWLWNQRSSEDGRSYEATGLMALTLTIAEWPIAVLISKHAHWSGPDGDRATTKFLVLGAVLSAYAVVCAFTGRRTGKRAFRISSVALCVFYSLMSTVAIYASFHNGEI